MKTMKLKALMAAVVGAVALSACSSINGVDTQWPDYSKAHYQDRQKAYPNPQVFEMIKPTVSRSKVFDLLGAPHFDDLNLASAHTWDYVFHFRTPGVGANNESICQFKVVFDTDGYVQSYYWHAAEPKDIDCPPATGRVAPQKVAVDADALFGFDKDKIRPESQQKLDALVSNLGRLQNITAIQVVGYTDPIGNPTYNQGLSERRARSVGQYLVKRGVPANAIQAAGRGEANPVVNCEGKGREAIKCNAPNRRVEVQVQGQAVPAAAQTTRAQQ
ncbi:OmpA family protein [Brackiella oedipodis]|uniref:OmpA family protein n=1 Tax=Brackiella oedipodis TaxID=124225 RepID=UPI00057072EB|nr:OmpA family protein [Brackiella oedipodis]